MELILLAFPIAFIGFFYMAIRWLGKKWVAAKAVKKTPKG